MVGNCEGRDFVRRDFEDKGILSDEIFKTKEFRATGF